MEDGTYQAILALSLTLGVDLTPEQQLEQQLERLCQSLAETLPTELQQLRGLVGEYERTARPPPRTMEAPYVHAAHTSPG